MSPSLMVCLLLLGAVGTVKGNGERRTMGQRQLPAPISVEASVQREDPVEAESSRFCWYREAARYALLAFAECRRETDSFKAGDPGFNSPLIRLKNCIERRILRDVDDLVNRDNIYLNSFLSLVKVKNRTLSERIHATSKGELTDFFAELEERMEYLLRTHDFRIHTSLGIEDDTEGRRRHQYKKAFPMMVAGFMMMSSFLVPMGFQFMAMVGGKALLLSKIAFLMSMYNGYRRMHGDAGAGHDLYHQHQPWRRRLHLYPNYARPPAPHSTLVPFY